MEKLFKEYEKKYRQLSKKIEKKLPRALRLFDIRLRLALGICVDFDSDVSLTKTQTVKDCYILLIRLTELWNAFEALIAYTREKYNIKKWFDLMKDKDIHSEESSNCLTGGLNKLKQLYKNKSFTSDFDSFVEKAKRQLSEANIAGTNLNNLSKLQSYLKKNDKEEENLMMSLINIERNLFYHSGESAKMGVSNYNNRKKSLELCYEILREYILININNILAKVINEP